MLRVPSPHTLKKYGLYAVLSFFIGLSSYLIMYNLTVGSNNLRYERQRQEQLQQIILDQVRLQNIQKNLLRDTVYVPIRHVK